MRPFMPKDFRMGVRISPQQVFTAGEATVYYIQSIGIRSGARLYVAGTKYLKEDFREAGYDPIGQCSWKP